MHVRTRVPLFFSLFFFLLSGQVKLSRSNCRVSAPQGKDYFIMKPTHMLVRGWCGCQIGIMPKGIGLSRCMKCGNKGVTAIIYKYIAQHASKCVVLGESLLAYSNKSDVHRHVGERLTHREKCQIFQAHAQLGRLSW